MKKRSRIAKTIDLNTQDDRKSLLLDNFERYGSNAFKCRIKVNSFGFSCDRPFIFDNAKEVLSKLRELNENLTGFVKLEEEYEENNVTISIDKAGHVKIAGFLIDYERGQELKFSFITDQTILPKLVKDFEILIDEVKNS